MKAHWVAFGEIEIDGRRYDHDVAIDGTGMYGRLPVMPEVVQEAARRKIELVVVPTKEACRLLADCQEKNVHAVLHVTC